MVAKSKEDKRTGFNLRSDPAEIKDLKKWAKKSGLKTVTAYVRHLHLNYKESHKND